MRVKWLNGDRETHAIIDRGINSPLLSDMPPRRTRPATLDTRVSTLNTQDLATYRAALSAYPDLHTVLLHLVYDSDEHASAEGDDEHTSDEGDLEEHLGMSLL